jgi:SAM-dependent methyltransferase
MPSPAAAPPRRFRFERFPFMVGVRAPDDGAALPTALPFEMAVDPRAALPRLVVTDEVEAALQAAYSIGSMISTPLGHSALSMARLEEARDRLLGLLGDVRGKRMLEIGCGTGMLLNEFKERGADVVGCEIGPQGAEAEARYGIPVLREPIRAGSFDQPFDCIYSYGTLEHIADLEGLFGAFRASLVDGGLLFHSVPNAENTFRSGRVEELLHEHVNYFTPANAVRLLEAQGFGRARAEPTAAGNELHLWGWFDPSAPVGWPGEREPGVVEAEHARVAEFFDRADALLDGQEAAVRRMLDAGESVGFYAGGYLLGARLPADADVRYYDGDEYKHGKVWLAGLSPIRPPSDLARDPVDHLIVCPDHYFEPIHANLVERVGLPVTTRVHRMRRLHA